VEGVVLIWLIRPNVDHSFNVSCLVRQESRHLRSLCSPFGRGLACFLGLPSCRHRQGCIDVMFN